jgi:structural maintenance of chromosomes protein 5
VVNKYLFIITPSPLRKWAFVEMASPRKRQRASELSSCDFSPDGLDLGKYPVGSILRIKLANFVTFKQCIFNPGPALNMIIGPNGSGKSTIVAALAIGLGWPPSVLGRSKDIREYIKHGQSSSTVELVLHSTPTKEFKTMLGKAVTSKNWTSLRRKFSLNGISEWHVNDIPTTLKHVNEIVSYLGIQIDNLCQFLPQDRVSEFARLTPVQLFMETQKAAGPLDSISKQQRLTELFKERTAASENFERQTHELASLRQANQNLESKIQRIREYRQHIRNIEIAKMKRPFVEYSKIQGDRELLVSQKKDLEKIVAEKVQNEVEPLELELDEIKTELDKINRAVSSGKLKKPQDKLKNLQEEITSLERDCKLVRIEAEDNWKAFQKKKRSVEECRESIAKIENEIANIEVVPFDPNYRLEEMNELENRITAMQPAMRELEAEQRRIQNESLLIGRRVDSISQELRQFNEVKNNRLTFLNQKDPETAKVYRFLCDNRAKFPTAVGPVLLELNVKNNWAIRMVESCISRNILSSFVFTDKEEHRQFMDEADASGLLPNTILLTDLEEAKRLLKEGISLPEEFKNAGFEGFLMQQVDAPLEVFCVLMEQAFLHKVPFAISNAR